MARAEAVVQEAAVEGAVGAERRRGEVSQDPGFSPK